VKYEITLLIKIMGLVIKDSALHPSFFLSESAKVNSPNGIGKKLVL
jgi:hypothetical protein